MNYVVDASVAAKWFLREDLRADAVRLLDQASRLHAPDWIIPEIAHVAFRKWRDGEIEAAQARTMVQALPSFLAKLYPSAGFADRALAIAMTVRHPVYDCLYIACAEMTGAAVVTADNRLRKVVEGTEFAHLVRHLSEVVA